MLTSHGLAKMDCVELDNSVETLSHEAAQNIHLMETVASRKVWIENEKGERLEIELQNEGGELLGKVFVNQIPYHVFLAKPNEIGCGGKKFVVDRDPGYEPKRISNGEYLLIAPHAQ